MSTDVHRFPGLNSGLASPCAESLFSEWTFAMAKHGFEWGLNVK